MKPLQSALVVAGLAGLFASFSAPLRPATPAVAESESYKVDAVHSAVTFHTRHLGLSRADGRFNAIDAEKSKITLDSDYAKSSVVLVVKADSVDTNNGKRDEHLRSPDFLSAKEFPSIEFKSTRISGTDADLKVEGELTLHGVTKPVTARAQKLGSGEAMGAFRAGFVAEFTVDMREFGIEMMKKNPSAVGPEVTLTVALECTRE